MSFGARVRIRLSALTHNLKQIQSAAPDAKVMAVIKANAYGHGMVAVANELTDVDAFAVARLQEALELRDNGISKDIVLFAGVFDEDELQLAIDRRLQVVVHCAEQVDLLDAAAKGALTVWLKVDTGMNRLGFKPAEAATMLSRLRGMESVHDVRLMSHLSNADDTEDDTTTQQFNEFVGLVDDSITDISICNSAGVLGWPNIQAQCANLAGTHWVRPGIALFGISPFAQKTANELGLQAAMQFEARLMAIKTLAVGAYVGYKKTYRNKQASVLGVVSVGYGDGYSRHFRTGTPVLINNRKVPVIGNVSMDSIAVDLGNGATDKVGDVATLWGDGLPVEEVAPWANAIPYELVCGVLNRA